MFFFKQKLISCDDFFRHFVVCRCISDLTTSATKKKLRFMQCGCALQLSARRSAKCGPQNER